MVDDYTAKMTELIELMRMIGNDTQQCEVKECKRKISSTITDTLSAFSNGSGGWIILGPVSYTHLTLPTNSRV